MFMFIECQPRGFHIQILIGVSCEPTTLVNEADGTNPNNNNEIESYNFSFEFCFIFDIFFRDGLFEFVFCTLFPF